MAYHGGAKDPLPRSWELIQIGTDGKESHMALWTTDSPVKNNSGNLATLIYARADDQKNALIGYDFKNGFQWNTGGSFPTLSEGMVFMLSDKGTAAAVDYHIPSSVGGPTVFQVTLKVQMRVDIQDGKLTPADFKGHLSVLEKRSGGAFQPVSGGGGSVSSTSAASLQCTTDALLAADTIRIVWVGSNSSKVTSRTAVLQLDQFLVQSR